MYALSTSLQLGEYILSSRLDFNRPTLGAARPGTSRKGSVLHNCSKSPELTGCAW